jgi:hypothetical protein
MKPESTQGSAFEDEGSDTMKKPFLITVLIALMLDLFVVFFLNLCGGKVSAETTEKMTPPAGYGVREERPYPGMMPGPDGMMRHESPPGMMMDFKPPLWRYIRKLGLDERQMKELRTVRERIMKERIRKEADMQITGIELKELLDKDPVDLKAAGMKLKRIETIKTEMHLSFLRAMEEVKAKLNPGQRSKFMEMLRRGPMGEMEDEPLPMIQPFEMPEDMIQEMDLGLW